MTLKELQKWLEDYEHNTINECKSIMVDEAPARTGGLRYSIVIETRGGGVYWVGTHKEYASYVEYGRGPVAPISKKALHWVDPLYGSVFTKHAGPMKANDFVGRTLKRFKSYLSSYK